MKFNKYKVKNKKMTGKIIFTVCCIFLVAGIFLYRSFALYEQVEGKNIIEGNVEDLGDVSFTYYIDDKVAIASPSKEDGKVFDDKNSSCTNGASIRWNYEEWGPLVTEWNKTKTKCYLKFKSEYNESVLNGALPELKDPLIPVTIENDGTVKRADLGTEWYNYTNKKWANAIILKDESTEGNYRPTDVIPENAIESYFVWIPRYRYKIFNNGNYTGRDGVSDTAKKTIEIAFENKDTTPSTGTAVGAWLTHPAFTSFNTNGMWVAKFETGKNGGSDNVRNADQIQIKPGVSSWRSIQVANAFYTSYDYKRNLESHMMKNTEWGAVAYLQHSVYGSGESVRINNNSSYLTGYSAVKEPTCGYTATNEECNKYGTTSDITQPYNTATGYLASTTKNISGVYDMSGGAWEYMMGVMLDQSGVPMSGRNSLYNSGFNGTLGCPTCDSDTSGVTKITNGYEWPDKRYYDTYAYSTSDQHFERRILGDAIGEMGPFGTVTYTGSNGSQTRSISSWYADYAYFVSSSNPWFYRGSNHNDGLGAGVFAFYNHDGRALGWISFRVVLTP